MRSDRNFTSTDTLLSATVASDRSGNERAVRIMKQSHYVVKGLRPGANPVRLNMIWECWGFLVNFMYQPVH